MKRFVLILVMGLVAFGFNVMSTRPVSARPQYKAKFEEMTKNSKAAESIKEAKCNVCHFGMSKKNRNDFGKAVNKTMNKEIYDSLKSDKEQLAKKVEEAIKAAFKEKSPEGKTFGELIEAGQLPAKNPEK